MNTFFFFKQKTAYEIVDCDWSSDVCSSDLLKVKIAPREHQIQQRSEALWLRTVRQRLSDRAQQQRTLTDLNQENVLRRELAERLLPLPAGQNQGLSDVDADISEDEFDEVFR